MDRFETVAQFGIELGCLVCPSTSNLQRYGGWQALLHEIGHFAIAPPFLRNIPAHVDAVASEGKSVNPEGGFLAATAWMRPPVPAIDAFAVGIDHHGGFHTGVALWSDGELAPTIAAIAENPNPLTDWHVRAWTVWAADRLGLPTPGSLWLGTTPWADLLCRAHLDHSHLNRPPGWAERHPEQVDRWELRAAAAHNPEQELQWRLEDLPLQWSLN